jgi:hypothetical protein
MCISVFGKIYYCYLPLKMGFGVEDLIDLKKVREVVNEHIKLAIGELEEDPRITFAIREKHAPSPAYGREVWRINIEYTPQSKKPTDITFSRTSLFIIDAKTAEVLEFTQDRYWAW